MANESKLDEGKKDEDLFEEGEEGKEKEGEGDGKGADGEGEGEGDKKPNKHADESPEDRSARLRRMSDQHDKKHKLGKYAESSDDKPTSKSGELDYGQLAFLSSKGIDTDDDGEVEFVKNAMKESGKELKELFKSPYFQTELKDFKEKVETSKAIPKGSKRSGTPAVNSVEYWIAKGEMPPDTSENRKLRQDIVNAKMKKDSGGSPFSSQSVVK